MFFLYVLGHNPIWDESFEFQINLPELALVRFSVLDDEFIADDFIGQYTLPFECMQTGKLHLMNRLAPFIHELYILKNISNFLKNTFFQYSQYCLPS